MAVEGADPKRRDKLIEMLDIDLQWRMHKVSDGQRRRVQICMGLLHPYKVFRRLGVNRLEIVFSCHGAVNYFGVQNVFLLFTLLFIQ